MNIDNGNLLWQTPTQSNTIYEEGFFITPPEYYRDEYSFEVDYQSSLQAAVNAFLTLALSGESCSIVDFDLSLKTTKLVLDAQLSQ